MRMMMTVGLDTEAANTAVRNGTLAMKIQKILADLKPEACYFTADNDGCRSGIIVFDMHDSSQMVALAEPWFLAFNAKIAFRPVMNPQDLANAGPGFEHAVREH